MLAIISDVHGNLEALRAVLDDAAGQGAGAVYCLGDVVGEQAPDDLYQFHSPEEVGHAWRLDGRKTLCNVGSVGQPRDGDPRACYVLLDSDTVRFRRVEYDFAATARKILAVPDLDPF